MVTGLSSRLSSLAGSHRSGGLETSQVPSPGHPHSRAGCGLRLAALTGYHQDVPLPKGPPMIVECTPQLPQNGSPNCLKSLTRMFRKPSGMHPVNRLL